MSAASERYLAELAASPAASPRVLRARASVTTGQLAHLRQDPEFKAKEKALKVAHQAAVREQVALLEQQRAAAGILPADLDPTIPTALQAWLAAYKETDDRMEAVRRVNAAGVALTWADVRKGLEDHAGFRRRFVSIWEEGVVEAEDKGLRKKARAGGFQAAKMVLEAEMPDKYGQKLAVKHQHGGTVRLELGHAPAVEAAKEHFLSRYRLGPAPAEDIVEGEVIG